MGHADRTRPGIDERLINRFDYDGDYGTVLNRFLMQAAIGYPLTVHGTGGQTRAFIHIQDTVRCIAARHREPAERRRAGADLQPDDRDPPGDRPGRAGRAASPARRSTCVDNPRKEAAENDLFVETAACSTSASIRSRSRRTCCARSPRSPTATRDRCDLDKIPCALAVGEQQAGDRSEGRHRRRRAGPRSGLAVRPDQLVLFVESADRGDPGPEVVGRQSSPAGSASWGITSDRRPGAPAVRRSATQRG